MKILCWMRLPDPESNAWKTAAFSPAARLMLLFFGILSGTLLVPGYSASIGLAKKNIFPGSLHADAKNARNLRFSWHDAVLFRSAHVDIR